MRKMNKRGIAAFAVIGIAMMVVVGVIFLAIMLPTGLSISQTTSNLFNYPMVTGSSSYWNATNATLTTTNTNIMGGWNLLSISPTVLAAGGIISILIAAFAVVIVRQEGT